MIYKRGRNRLMLIPFLANMFDYALFEVPNSRILPMTVSLIAPGLAFSQSNAKVSHSLNDSTKVVEVKVSDRLLSSFKDDEYVTFLVKFNEKAEVKKVAEQARKNAEKAGLSNLNTEHITRSAVIAELKEISLTSQRNVKDFVEAEIANGNAKEFESYHIVNGMAVTATKEVAEKIATFAEVEKLLPNETLIVRISAMQRRGLPYNIP